MSSQFQTTPERRANLVKLARFLYTEPIDEDEFSMSRYFARQCDSDKIIASASHKCGSAGCAVGWAPAAGIPFVEGDTWGKYQERELISANSDYDFSEWCFGSFWVARDNTPRGAAKRIIWLLTGNDIPEFGYVDYESPLPYTGWEPTEADWQSAEAPCTPA